MIVSDKPFKMKEVDKGNPFMTTKIVTYLDDEGKPSGKLTLHHVVNIKMARTAYLESKRCEACWAIVHTNNKTVVSKQQSFSGVVKVGHRLYWHIHTRNSNNSKDMIEHLRKTVIVARKQGYGLKQWLEYLEAKQELQLSSP